MHSHRRSGAVSGLGEVRMSTSIFRFVTVFGTMNYHGSVSLAWMWAFGPFFPSAQCFVDSHDVFRFGFLFIHVRSLCKNNRIDEKQEVRFSRHYSAAKWSSVELRWVEFATSLAQRQEGQVPTLLCYSFPSYCFVFSIFRNLQFPHCSFLLCTAVLRRLIKPLLRLLLLATFLLLAIV